MGAAPDGAIIKDRVSAAKADGILKLLAGQEFEAGYETGRQDGTGMPVHGVPPFRNHGYGGTPTQVAMCT